MVAELKKGVLIDAELRIILGEISAHEIRGEYIRPGRDRRMRGKDRSSFHLRQGSLKGYPFFHPFTDPLQLGKRRMPFIEMQG